MEPRDRISPRCLIHLGEVSDGPARANQSLAGLELADLRALERGPRILGQLLDLLLRRRITSEEAVGEAKGTEGERPRPKGPALVEFGELQASASQIGHRATVDRQPVDGSEERVERLLVAADHANADTTLGLDPRLELVAV